MIWFCTKQKAKNNEEIFFLQIALSQFPKS